MLYLSELWAHACVEQAIGISRRLRAEFEYNRSAKHLTSGGVADGATLCCALHDDGRGRRRGSRNPAEPGCGGLPARGIARRGHKKTRSRAVLFDRRARRVESALRRRCLSKGTRTELRYGRRL